MIKLSDWEPRRKDIIKIYKSKGLEKAVELFVTSGVNLMVAYHFIWEESQDEKVKDKRDKLLAWYGEELVC